MNDSTEARRKAAAELAARLCELMTRTGISGRALADAVGISYASLCSLRSGKTEPGFTLPILLADYFGVPLDYLCGRCDEETAKAVLTDYAKHFMCLRRAAYEEYLCARKTINAPPGYESPWPYNLVEAVGAKLSDPILRSDQEEGLMRALGTLPPRTQEVLLEYYRDGNPLPVVGAAHNVTQERIRQILAKGIRLLAHPSRVKLIEEGYDETLARERAALQERQTKYAKEISKVDAALAALDEKRRLIVLLRGRLDELVKWDAERRKIPDDGSPASKDLPIDEMYLTVRAYNVLHRAGINTLGQLVEAYQSDRLLGLRCMGRKTYAEITEKMRYLLAVDSVDDLKGIKVWA